MFYWASLAEVQSNEIEPLRPGVLGALRGKTQLTRGGSNEISQLYLTMISTPPLKTMRGLLCLASMTLLLGASGYPKSVGPAPSDFRTGS